MSAAFDYDTFVARNSGYVDAATQRKMRASRLLIAGCGLGASTAIAACRMGFEQFVPAAPRMVAHSFRNHATRLIDISAG